MVLPDHSDQNVSKLFPQDWLVTHIEEIGTNVTVYVSVCFAISTLGNLTII
jgi:hypothetical protein